MKSHKLPLTTKENLVFYYLREGLGVSAEEVLRMAFQNFVKKNKEVILKQKRKIEARERAKYRKVSEFRKKIQEDAEKEDEYEGVEIGILEHEQGIHDDIESLLDTIKDDFEL